MLHYFRFRSDLPGLVPASETYGPRERGRGWPDQCPPLRAANAFGWDVPAAFEMTFRKPKDGSWRILRDVEVESDWGWAPPGADPKTDARPLVQRNAWFWDPDQTVPHVISPSVYARIRNQVKVSTYLYLRTDKNEMLQIGDLPNQRRGFRAFTAIVETDRYPASYPWHVVLELDPDAREVHIAKGEPICRLTLVRRGAHAARAMPLAEFDRFFERGQRWLAKHGKGERSEMMDITGAYARLQRKARFTVR